MSAAPSSNVASAAPDALPALERLERSRQRLHRVWRETHRDPDASESARPPGSPAPTWIDLTLSAAARWWHQHPWRSTGLLAAQVAAPAARAALTPVAQDHPRTLIAASVAGGALLVWSRPWRWLPQAALSSALLSVLWPRGSLKPWLDAGGQWLAGDGLARVLAGFAARPGDAQTDRALVAPRGAEPIDRPPLP